MAGINVDDLVTQLGDYHRKHASEIKKATLGKNKITEHFKTVMDVSDEYWANHAVTNNVVAGFAATWVEMGTTKFKANKVQARHLKVNYPIIPSTVLESFAATMYNEGVDPTAMEISKFIMDDMMRAIERDRGYLLAKGIYDETDAPTVFGASVDGIDQVLKNGILDGTMYKIPLPAFASNTAASNVELFARSIPTELRGMIDKLFMSEGQLDAYKADFRDTYGQYADYNRDGLVKEYFTGLPIIGLPHCENGRVWATYAENRVHVMNKVSQPIISDIQKADYKIKVFADWFEGLGFHINQHVLVSTLDSAGYGSGIATDSAYYFVTE